MALSNVSASAHERSDLLDGNVLALLAPMLGEPAACLHAAGALANIVAGSGEACSKAMAAGVPELLVDSLRSAVSAPGQQSGDARTLERIVGALSRLAESGSRQLKAAIVDTDALELLGKVLTSAKTQAIRELVVLTFFSLASAREREVLNSISGLEDNLRDLAAVTESQSAERAQDLLRRVECC